MPEQHIPGLGHFEKRSPSLADGTPPHAGRNQLRYPSTTPLPWSNLSKLVRGRQLGMLLIHIGFFGRAAL